MAFRKNKINRQSAEEDFLRFIDNSEIDFGYEISEENVNGEKTSVVELETEKDELIFNSIVPLIEKGWLTVDESGSLTQKLQYPLIMNEDSTRTVHELKYANRLQNSSILKNLSSFKHDDKDGRILANYAARTGKSISTLKRLDAEDSSRADLITMLCFLS